MIPVCSAIGMKLSGRRKPVARMVPAKQRLGAGDFAGDEAQLRLEGEHELAALDRFGQRLFGLDLCLMLGGQFVVEQAMRPPPSDLARYMAMSAARISDSMLVP